MYQREKQTHKQANPSVLISTVLLSRAVQFCPKLVGPKGKQNDQRLDRNGKRSARAFSREDRAIGPLRVFKLMSHLSYQISFLSIYKRRALDGIVINTLIPGHPLPHDLWLLLPGSPACWLKFSDQPALPPEDQRVAAWVWIKVTQ